MIERWIVSRTARLVSLEVVTVHRIAGYAALLEPGAVDPVQAQILAAARAFAAGQALVCEPATGALMLVDPDYESDEFDMEFCEPAALPVSEPPVPPELLGREWPLDGPECPHEACESAQVCLRGQVYPGESGDLGGLHRAACLAECCEYELAEFDDVAPDCAESVSPSARRVPGASAVSDEPGVRVPRRLPEELGELPGGAELARVLETVQLRDIGAYELVEFVAACQRVSSAMDALQASAVSELSRRVEMRPAAGVRTESMTTGRITALEVGARLMTSDDDAGRLVSRASVVCEQLPDTFTLWRSGVLPTEKVDVIMAKLGRVDSELAREVEARILPGATRRTSQSLRRQITRLLNKLAPKSAEKRHAEKKAERFVRITPAPDGMAWLEAYLAAEDAAAVKAVLDAGAATLKRHDDATGTTTGSRHPTGSRPAGGDPAGGDPAGGDTASGDAGGAEGAEELADDAGSGRALQRRTAANRRADVLAALAWAVLEAGAIGGCGHASGSASGVPGGSGESWPGGGFTLSSVHGRAVAVNVTVPLTTLLGETDEPGELAGFGSVSAEAARRLAAHGTWRRIVTDPLTGAVLDVGRTRYTPPRDLADHVMTRDQRCVWPTCDRPVGGPGMQLDHTIAFEDGGVTAHTNLGPFCDKNHIDKHQAGWTVRQPEPGRFVFLSPTGHVYTTELEPVGPTPDHEPGQGSMPAGDPPPF